MLNVSQSLSGLSVTHHRQEAHQWEQKKNIVQQIKDNDWSPEPTPTSFSCLGYILGNCQYNLRTVSTIKIRRWQKQTAGAEEHKTTRQTTKQPATQSTVRSHNRNIKAEVCWAQKPGSFPPSYRYLEAHRRISEKRSDVSFYQHVGWVCWLSRIYRSKPSFS